MGKNPDAEGRVFGLSNRDTHGFVFKVDVDHRDTFDSSIGEIINFTVKYH